MSKERAANNLKGALLTGVTVETWLSIVKIASDRDLLGQFDFTLQEAEEVAAEAVPEEAKK